MKKLLMVFAACGLLSTLVLNADNISYPYTLGNNDTLTTAKYKANNNAIKNVVNGNLTNANLKSTANISQSKIDSSTGWIRSATGGIKTSGNFLEIHSPKGIKLFLNDTASYDHELVLYSDSTDSIMKMSNDSVWLYKPVGGSSVSFGGKIIGDSLVASGISCATINTGLGSTEIPVYTNAAFQCSLFLGGVYQDQQSASYTKSGNVITIKLPATTVASSDGSEVTLRGFPASIRPTTGAYAIVRIISNSVKGIGILGLNSASSTWVLTTAAHENLAAGASGIEICCFSYSLD